MVALPMRVTTAVDVASSSDATRLSGQRDRWSCGLRPVECLRARRSHCRRL